ncbi:MAG: long-chain-fatty-acid--CoA ligase [Paracoccaceae bacterium]|nr:long-chain-fatty-acid--CoA ligase [Paracoccaceae bacterium]
MKQNKNWPAGVPKNIVFPKQTLPENLLASAQRVPLRKALIFYGAEYTYQEVLQLVERLSGYLQSVIQIKPDEPVLLYMQNSPQFIISFYAILHAGGVVIPVNPMSRKAELNYIQKDTDSRLVIAGSEVSEFVQPLLMTGAIEQLISTNYADMTDPEYDLCLPASLYPHDPDLMRKLGYVMWQDAISSAYPVPPVNRSASDLAVIPYSSGTTGNPKGCMHSHYTVNVTAVGGVVWHQFEEDSISLATLPMFHVTGMQGAMNGPIYAAGTLVIMARWDRQIAAELIRRYQITRWRSIATMAIDFVNDPNIRSYDLSSLKAVGGGGTAMPAPIARKLKDLTGLDYLEGYGLSETMAATHLNPTDAPRAQCLGIAVFDVKSCIWSPQNHKKLGPNEIGEILIAGPQVFLGYWRRPEDTKEAFVTLDGVAYFRTGDIGYVDEDGFFYMVDRLKRMINASGFKVWPAEVEAIMYGHPAIAEACVIASKDPRRGETVKAIVVKTRNEKAPSPREIISWCKTMMAAYKCPTEIEFVEVLPKSGSGKVMWRALTDKENTHC